MRDRAEIFHITVRDCYEKAKLIGEYRPDDFEKEGFIHCSYRVQVINVANTRFRDVNGLVLLRIDTRLIEDKILEENLEGGEELFPHIYCPLPINAVIDVQVLARDPNGSFMFPPQWERFAKP